MKKIQLKEIIKKKLDEIRINKPVPNNLSKLLELQKKIEDKSISKEDKVKYAIECAELVLPIWNHYYPNDNRVKETIESAKRGEYNSAAADAYYAAADTAAADAAYAVYYANYANYAAADTAAAYADYTAKRAIKATKLFFKLNEIKINTPGKIPLYYSRRNVYFFKIGDEKIFVTDYGDYDKNITIIFIDEHSSRKNKIIEFFKNRSIPITSISPAEINIDKKNFIIIK